MSKEREKRIKLLKALTDEQLINELRRRRNADHDFKLAWIHKDAFFNHPGDIEKAAEEVSKEAEKEAKETAGKDQQKESKN